MSDARSLFRTHASWRPLPDALLAAAAVLGPLLMAAVTDGPPLPADPLAILARTIGALAAWRLLRQLDALPQAAWWASLLYASAGLREHATAGAGLALLLLAVAITRQHSGRALVCAAGGLALALGGEPQAGTLALAAVAPWAVWRFTCVPSGWDSRAASPLLVGSAIGALLTAPVWWQAAALPAGTPPRPLAVACLTTAALALTILVVDTAARAGAGRHRAFFGLLGLWLVLYIGRAEGMGVASFIVDIAAPMSDAAFVSRATPGLSLAALIIAVSLSTGRLWRRLLAGALALAVGAVGVISHRGDPVEHEVAYGAVVHERPLSLAPGQSVHGVIAGPGVRAGLVRGFGIEIGTYRGAADGRLELTLCAGPVCRSGQAKIDGVVDNAVLWATLDARLATAPDGELAWRAVHVGGHIPVAIWLGKASDDAYLDGPDGRIAAASAHVVLRYSAEDRAASARPP